MVPEPGGDEKRPKTAKYYKDIKEIHLDPYFGEVKVGRIDFALIEKYMAFKLTKGRLNKDSINKTVTALRTILKYAVRRKFIDPTRSQRGAFSKRG